MIFVNKAIKSNNERSEYFQHLAKIANKLELFDEALAAFDQSNITCTKRY